MYAREKAGPDAATRGFTLVEMMISMAIGLIILLGMMMMFISDAKVSDTMASRTDRLSDLFLVSQIMQGELRNAQAGTISWSSNVLSYTNQDGNSGSFAYQYSGNNDAIYWLRPTFSAYQEMIRDLDTTSGMVVSGTASGVWTITLKSSYQDVDRTTKTVDLSFKVWARN